VRRLIASCSCSLAAPAGQIEIYTIEVLGPIFTAVLQYLTSALGRRAGVPRRTPLLLELDTPGGSLETTEGDRPGAARRAGALDRLRGPERRERDVRWGRSSRLARPLASMAQVTTNSARRIRFAGTRSDKPTKRDGKKV